jgi:hypothetical protein
MPCRSSDSLLVSNWTGNDREARIRFGKAGGAPHMGQSRLECKIRQRIVSETLRPKYWQEPKASIPERFRYNLLN